MALQKFKAPSLPVPPVSYDQQYMTQLVRVLGTYFNLLDSKTPQEIDTVRLVALPTDDTDLREGSAFRLPTEDLVRIVVDGITPEPVAVQSYVQAEIDALEAQKVNRSGDIMTGNLSLPTLNATSVVIGAFTIQETAGKLTFSVAGNPIGSLDTSGNFTVIGNVTGYGTP
jgi:hypothetical protein